jgi:hypothetical protein
MTSRFPGQAVLGYLRAFLGIRMSRLAEARQNKDLGASAIELAIITAVLVLAAAGVVTIIFNVVSAKKGEIQSNSNNLP